MPRPAPHITAACLCASLALCSPRAIAQRAVNDPGLKPVEQGVADRSPLSASQRVAPADLRMPLDFERVYRIEAASRRRPFGDLYARRSGAVTAVFPRSQYVDTSFGSLAEVPAGTVYYIGTDAASRAIGDESLPSGVWRPTGAPSTRPAVDRRAMNTYVDLSARESLASGVRDGRASDAVRPSTAARDGARPATPGDPPDRDPRDPAGSDARPIRDPASLRDHQPAAGVTPLDSDRTRSPEPLFRRDPAERPTLFRSEEFRARRVGDLLDRARGDADADRDARRRDVAGGSMRPAR